MRGKFWFAAAGVAIAGIWVFPAATASAAPADSGKPMASHHHRTSCYDFAWQSQEMKDCMAKHASAEKPTMHHHHMVKKPT